MVSWLSVMNRSEGPYTTPVDANTCGPDQLATE